MIPPDLLARALDAYREHNPGPLDGFNAALSVLSAAWPVADGRLREALKAILSLGREERSLIISPWGHMAAMADIAEGALSPPSAPAADMACHLGLNASENEVRRIYDAILAAYRAAGWKLTRREATQHMQEAALGRSYREVIDKGLYRSVWETMHDAAPSPEEAHDP